MKVKELIEKLKTFDPELEVIYSDIDRHMPIEQIEERNFKDASMIEEWGYASEWSQKYLDNPKQLLLLGDFLHPQKEE